MFFRFFLFLFFLEEIETVWPLPDIDLPYHILSKPKPPPFEDKTKKAKKDDELKFNEEEEKEQKKLDKKLLEYLRVLREKVEKERFASKKKEGAASLKLSKNVPENVPNTELEKETKKQTQEKKK